MILFVLTEIYFIGYIQNNDLNSCTLVNRTEISVQFKLNHSRIHLAVFSDQHAQEDYQQYADTIYCYAHRHGYYFTIVDPDNYYACRAIENFFFKKQCTVLQYLIQNPDIQWLVVLDGDTFVVNATKSLDAFIPTDPNIHLVHYERFMNNEIMAGNYIIRNHPWSMFYLNRWTEYFENLPRVHFHNADNGALHLHFLNMSGMSDSQTYDRCSRRYNESHNELLYMKYVSCVKCALKGRRKFSNMVLHRRGHSFCRDIGLSPHKIHELDIMLHGYKDKKLDHFLEEPIDRLKCQNNPEWTPKIRQLLHTANIFEAKMLIREWEKTVSQRFIATVFNSEVGSCWPDCEPEITGTTWEIFALTLCRS